MMEIYIIITYDIIINLLEVSMNNITIGRYRHFKGNEYEILYIAKDSETSEPMVVYRALYGECEIWVRSLKMWNETVERDGMPIKRFTYISE